VQIQVILKTEVSEVNVDDEALETPVQQGTITVLDTGGVVFQDPGDVLRAKGKTYGC